jgi:hypothetical protein
MKKIYLLTFSLLLLNQLCAQDLLSTLSESIPTEKEFVYQTFKGTRVINGQSVEVKGKGELEFIIGHRFGRINSGAYDFFGWDDAYIRFGLEYGITSRLGIGIGRSSYDKIYDGYFRYQLLRQSKGGGSPVTITAIGSTGVRTVDRDWPVKSQMYYSGQALIARKFTTNLSLQLSSVFVHANRVDQLKENNDQLAIGLSGRCKITKSIAINGEYFYRVNPIDSGPYYNAISMGIDIETGGHVFQLIFSNTQGMVDRTFIGRTEGDFFNGDIHFGFNITRTFQLNKQKRK